MVVEVAVVGIARTPMGAFQGALSTLSATELGAVAIKAALLNAGVAAKDVSEVLMGCVLSAGLGQAPARQAALAAGLPESIPCTTLNKVCGSGMKAIMQARQALISGDADVVVAGGMESMSGAPYLLPKAREGYRLGHGELLDSVFYDGLQDAAAGELMGVFAEACVDKYDYSRADQDAYALQSLMRAQSAIYRGDFVGEIAPVKVSGRNGDTVVAVDESPGCAKPEKIPQLKPAFKKQGSVTAANSSSIADGAAALVLMRKDDALAQGLNVLAVIKAQTQHAQAPQWFTTAPVSAIKKVLAKSNWQKDDVDLFEINEAFACVAMVARDELEINQSKLNISGGACALGHPIGASGARIVVTLIAALQRLNKSKGVAALCIGGGEATAMAFERC
jgi:acetyl-CoA C-acetyltransferase